LYAVVLEQILRSPVLDERGLPGSFEVQQVHGLYRVMDRQGRSDLLAAPLKKI